jgi:hypothetical protein
LLNFSILHLESACVGATAAKILDGAFVGESFFYILRAIRVQDLPNVALKDISKLHHTVGIKTAGNDRAVGKDRKVIAKPVAKYFLAEIIHLSVRPLEAFSELDMQLVAYSRAPLAYLLELAKSIAQQSHDVAV